MDTVHVPVLLHEIIEALALGEAGRKEQGAGSSASYPYYLDGTLGGAGHALAMIKAYGVKLNIVGLDRDMQAVERASKVLSAAIASDARVILACEDYRHLDRVLDDNSIPVVDRILLDLGLSSDELERSGRGFTFQRDEPLIMTMGDPANKDRHPFTAADIVNSWEEETLADIIFGYGEEHYARRIARNIVQYRLKKPIETTGELSEIIRQSVPPVYHRSGTSSGLRSAGKINPATRTFQALRIAVNDELGALKEGLIKGYERLAPGGRMAVISFHSLEDRIVKDFFRKLAADLGAVIVTKRPITASLQEIAENPRSRSAKLRVIQKLSNNLSNI